MSDSLLHLKTEIVFFINKISEYLCAMKRGRLIDCANRQSVLKGGATAASIHHAVRDEFEANKLVKGKSA